MDPATLSSIFGVARTGLSGIASNAPYLFENPHEQENAKQAAKLKHLMDSGALGLTADEQQRILSRQQGAAENQLQRTAAQSAQIQAAAVGSGEALKKAVLLGQSGAGIRQDISQGVEDLNQREAQRQREEYAARSAADQEAKDRRLRAWLGILTGYADATGSTVDQNKLLTGSAANPKAVADIDIAAQYMKDYGLSKEDAEALAAASSDDAELAASASKLLGSSSGGN